MAEDPAEPSPSRRKVNPLSTLGEEWLSLPELPTAEELNPDWSSGSTAADVMKNLFQNDVSRPYPSKMKYLETHYRLNREEGITFLRFGIGKYKQNPAMMDDENTCVYTKVFIQGYLMTRVGPVCRVQFSTERAGKKIRWMTSQRLTPGTLVAISTATDNFKTICKPAVVADRPIRDGLDRKPSTIQILWADLNDSVIDPAEELVMIESCRGFYEAVRHTLVGLQHVAGSSSPLLKYLVAGSNIETTPQYVLDQSKMDLTPLLVPAESTEKEKIFSTYRSCEVLNGFPQNIGNHTSLDDSQLQAVHCILTKELAICQGPPGTGKTFTSVQALRCMINTLTAGMTKATDEVIIVAAETNHAVDQMLSHLINSQIKVLRLGGRTRDEQIKKHNLFNFRKQITMSGRDRDLHGLEAARKRLIQDIGIVINETSSQDLLNPKLLLKHGIITQKQFDSLVKEEWTWQPSPGNPTGIMSEWLGTSIRNVGRRFSDPVFDDEEMIGESNGDGINSGDFNFDVDMGDPTFEVDEDSAHLKGTWLEIRREWEGLNLQRYPPSDVRIKLKLKNQDLFQIEEKWRGPIYEYWQRSLLAIQQKALSPLFANYTNICKNLKTKGWKRDVYNIKSMNIQIIGCTTTGLSKYRSLLVDLQPKVILIEEAAQSREAHIAAALFPTLQQLILVGDHQQLVPHCDVPGLADGFHNLTVSMFERLVSYLQLPYTMLNQQRRMISEIRAVLNPFYPNLGDHPSVGDKATRQDIPGMPYNSYLFSHEWLEQMDMDTFSQYNLNEAEMVARFALYLIQNGTSAKQITILTFYRGQRKMILTLLRRELAPFYSNINVNVSTVDSYQGEENDIILLSLVRSNMPNRPAVAGFVGDINRGVVSISRARRGFYIFGNIRNLEHATETSQFMWGSVRTVFERMDRCDIANTCSRLPLRCQNHGNISYAVDPEYFQQTHGGCWERCPDVFKGCGHSCGRLCHPMSHDKLICQHPCERQLPCGHGCSRICGTECYCGYKCPEFMGYIQQQKGKLANQHHSTPVNRKNPWDLYIAAYSDNDVAICSALKSNTLVNYENTMMKATPEHVRDEWHPISSDKGNRKVAKGVVLKSDTLQPGLQDFSPQKPPALSVPTLNHSTNSTLTASYKKSRSSAGSCDTVRHSASTQRAPEARHTVMACNQDSPCTPVQTARHTKQILYGTLEAEHSLPRIVNDWEISTTDGEEASPSAKLRQLAINNATNHPGDDNDRDLITF